MAAGRKTGGRVKGTLNKRTAAREAAVQQAAAKVGQFLADPFDGDAHMLLMTVYRDRALPIDLRVEAARAALPYEKPRLASVDIGNKDGEALVVKIVRFGESGDHTPE